MVILIVYVYLYMFMSSHIKVAIRICINKKALTTSLYYMVDHFILLWLHEASTVNVIHWNDSCKHVQYTHRYTCTNTNANAILTHPRLLLRYNVRLLVMCTSLLCHLCHPYIFICISYNI